MKVDKRNTRRRQEREKYAKLCVEVNLSKPLLTMFTIKERKNNIEYEGWHILCVKYGKVDYYKERCHKKNVIERGESTRKSGGGMGGSQDENENDNS